MKNNFKWKWQDTVIVILGLLTLAYALVNYSRLPAELPMHYNIRGEVDNYWSKGSAIAFGGFMGIIFPLAMQWFRQLDPKKENYNRFENAYNMIRLTLAVLLDAMLVLSVAHGLDNDLPVSQIAIAAAGLLFIVLGNFMPQIKDNYFTGIRTPWTLAYPEVWRKTHRLSGFLWTGGGLMILLGAFLPKPAAIGVIVAALLISTLIPVIYSWFIARRLKV